jgi:uncharacterized Zn finger protein
VLALLSEMQRAKINRTKVLAAMNTICPSCEHSISPAEILRVDSERMRCPKCGLVFEAGNSKRKQIVVRKTD